MAGAFALCLAAGAGAPVLPDAPGGMSWPAGGDGAQMQRVSASRFTGKICNNPDFGCDRDNAAFKAFLARHVGQEITLDITIIGTYTGDYWAKCLDESLPPEFDRGAPAPDSADWSLFVPSASRACDIGYTLAVRGRPASYAGAAMAHVEHRLTGRFTVAFRPVGRDHPGEGEYSLHAMPAGETRQGG